MPPPPRRTRRDNADPARELAHPVSQSPVREDWIPHLRLASRRARTRFLPGEGLHSVRRPSLRHRSANIGTTKTSAPDPTAPARSARHARSPDAAMSKKRVQRVCDGALCCPLCNIRTGTTNVFVFRPHRTSRPSDQPGCSRRATPVASQPICRPVRLRHKLSRVPLSQPRCPFRSKARPTEWRGRYKTS